MADLKLNKVIKRFGEVQTIHGVDLDIKHGEFVSRFKGFFTHSTKKITCD